MLSAVVGLALAVSVIIAVPGPSVLFIVGQALAGGRRPALLSLLGNSLGTTVAGLVVALVLGTAIRTVPWLQVLLTLLGALVLLVLGVQYLVQGRRERRARTTAALPDDVAAPLPPRPFITGVTVGLTNPKVAIMYGTVVPGFLPPGADPVLGLVVLSLVPTLVGFVSDGLWVELASRARAWLTGSPGSQALIRMIGGVLLVVLALLLAVEVLAG